MKIKVEIADDLYGQAKTAAALRGRSLDNLIAEGLRLILDTTRRNVSLADLMKPARGSIDSGVSDLASKRLDGFGGNNPSHRLRS